MKKRIRVLDEKKLNKIYAIGKVNKEIYSQAINELITDEVIITEERIMHIIQRRGQEFYDKYGSFFGEIIADPDYIFKDKENTVLVCKSFLEDNKYINIVLRLVVSKDDINYKNSIITAVGENSKRFQQRLRNNEPLYKKE